MAVAAITPNTPDVNRQNIVIWVTTDTDDPDTITLPTNAPNIDLSVENPVLSMLFLDTTDKANSEAFQLGTQVARNAAGTSDPDTAGEWKIATARTIVVKKTNAEAGFIAISYIAYGAQQQ